MITRAGITALAGLFASLSLLRPPPPKEPDVWRAMQCLPRVIVPVVPTAAPLESLAHALRRHPELRNPYDAGVPAEESR